MSTFPATNNQQPGPRTYKIPGLSCVDCAGRIEAAVNRLDGVEKCEVDHHTGRLRVWVDVPTYNAEPIARIVEDTGHSLEEEGARSRAQSAYGSGNSLVHFVRFMLDARERVLLLIATLFTLVGLSLSVTSLTPLLPRLAYTVAILAGGWPMARHAWQEVEQAHRLGINVLMVIAVIGALAIGEWSEAAIVVVLFALGETLESYAAARARGALESLLDLVPPVALRQREDGSLEEVPVAELAVGERVLVRAGDRISVDGVIVGGHSAVDQAAITGESIPVDKEPGDEVFAGTMNVSGSLEVEVTRLAEDNTLNRMIALVEEAQSQQAPVQRFVDRFAQVYTPAVAVAAALVAVLPPLLWGQPFWGERGWLLRALQMLVIACPCALVISTPVSVVSALTQAASRGVLVKGGRFLELLGRVDTFAFDKTGTLTEGRPVTTDVIDVCGDEVCGGKGLHYAAAVEAQSSHPLARALLDTAQAQQVPLWVAEDVNVLRGHGITGKVNGRTVTIASHAYCDMTLPHAEQVCAEVERLTAQGKTVMLVNHDEDVCSIFAVADQARMQSRAALAALRSLDGVSTLMLTGDNAAVARAIGAQVGVDEIQAELLPEEKVATVRRLIQEGHIVAMVGDGVNDVPALAQAHIGIAMGAAGSAQAMEIADVVLMGDDLRQLPALVRLSRRTRRVIRANIALALGIKAAVFALAATGLATLWMAIAADVGASLLVILNGLRLRRS